MDENAPYQYFEDVNWGLLRLWNKRRGLRVLDVGCGFATTSEHIQKLGNEVTGLESSEVAVDVASKRLAHVIQGDMLAADLGDRQFEAIIFADVLEHVPWPVSALQRYLKYLAPNGSVIVSLPNVGLWSVRLKHLTGTWDYEETGVLDRTHLRFFTRKSAKWLLAQNGLQPVKTTYNPGIVRPFVPLAKSLLAKPSNGAGAQAPDALLNSKPYQLYLKTAYPLERAIASLWPGMLAFQMIFEAKRTS
ncbi:MAG: class I SAM-dependent methyltransferase [Acidobacteriota bacterium]|nr:class I SAM-dependent methyltransferase [Acidobacteriota bacterium]